MVFYMGASTMIIPMHHCIPHAGRIYQNKQKQSTSLKRVAAGISSGLDFSNLFGRTYKRLLLLFLQSGGGTPPISTGEGQGCRMHMQHRRGTSSCDRLPQPNSDFTVHRIVIRSLQPFLRTSVYHTLRS